MPNSAIETVCRADDVRRVAELVKSAGGRALLVGGCVRDALRGETPHDFDFEVYGLPQERLLAALSSRYALDLVGASFGVIKLQGVPIDVALPRRETKLGLGHKAFATDFDPNLPLADAAARRDFTVNAIYLDPLTGACLDPWKGREDLAAGVLRPVSPHFAEDPLRVLRAMQFLARFDLAPTDDLLRVCRGMTPEGLPPERLFGEWEKLLVKGTIPSKGLQFLRQTGWVDYYPELKALIGCRQDPEWHPEGDVWAHTLGCLDAFAASRDGRDTMYDFIGDRAGWTPRENLIVGLAVLCHDFGKPATTFYDPQRKRIRSIGHDEEGVAPARRFLSRLTADHELLRAVPPLVRLHMRPIALWKSAAGDAAIRRLSVAAGRLDRLLRVAAADDAGRGTAPRTPEALRWLTAQAERLRVKESAPKPLVMGRHLIALGFKPGPRFSEMLAAAFNAQIEGKFATVADGLAFISAHFA